MNADRSDVRPPRVPRRPRVLGAVVLMAVVALAGHEVSWAAPREAGLRGPNAAVGLSGPNAALALPGAQAELPENPGRGIRYDGLQKAVPGASRCKRFEMRLASGEVACTHGPDPAPTGTDVREPAPIPSVAQEDAAVAAASLACQGDGVTGPRVQLVYARAAGVTDRYAALANNFQLWAAQMDDVVNQSAAETGGVRHVRFVHDAACLPIVARVQLSNAGDDNFTNTISELRAQGYNRSDRKYLVWMDANVYCGIAQVYEDSRPGTDNPNNGRSDIPGMVARVDAACWGQPNSVETHELVHALGAVQGAAPHATANGHCTDDYDRMCYADGTGVTTRILCASTGHENRLDCNHDDYFSTTPVAGSWLATHWNTANSSFLSGSGTPATTTTLPPTTTTTTVAPTTTTTRPPTTTTTTTVPPSSPSQAARFVDQAYRDVLGRPPSSAESPFWQNGLSAGYSRDGLGAQLTSSDEYRRLVVRAWYQTMLGRAPSPAELDAVVAYIAKGLAFQLVQAAIASTDEFYRRFGSTPGGFVDAVSWLAFGSAPDPAGRSFWIDQLARGLDRFSIARAFFTWTGAHQAVVRQAFSWFLDRPADAAGLAFWTAQLDQGLRQEHLYAYFVGSAEYWSKV